MGQFIFWNWQDDDATKNLNHRTLGISEPGRYRGFDCPSLAAPGGLVLRLTHATTGVDCTKFDDPVFTVERRGVFLTKQGVVIHDNEAALDFNISANVSAFPRIDLVIAEHSYVDVAGASAVIYSVEQGTPGASPVPPSLSPGEQIKTILGQLYIPAGTSALTDIGVIYTPAALPSPANDATIVRTFGEQEITGNKKFSGGTLAKVGEVLYASNELDFQGSSLNDFYLQSQGITFYLQINNFINVRPGAEGYRLRIKVWQKLSFVSGGNILTRDNIPIFVEPGDEVEIYDAWEIIGLAPAVHLFVVAKGGEANNSLPNKFRSMQSFSQGEGIYQVLTGVLGLGKDGNSYEATIYAGADINGIVHHEPSDFWLFTKPPVLGGAFVFIKFFTNPISGSVLLKHNQTVASNAKKILTPLGTDVSVKDGSLALFLEFTDRFELVSVLDPDNNHWTLKTQLDALTASLVPEPWKTVGAGGLMANGQSVPAFGATTSNTGGTAQTLRLRKDARGYVNIQGVVETSGVSNIVNIWGAFGLPIGYRPPADLVKLIKAKIVGLNEYRTIELYISSATGVMIGELVEPVVGTVTFLYEIDFNYDLV